MIDIGVGGGATWLPLAGRAGSILGIDAQADMLDGFLAKPPRRASRLAASWARGRKQPGRSNRRTWSWPGTSSTTSPRSNRSLERWIPTRAVEWSSAHREASARLDARPLAPIPRARTARGANRGGCACRPPRAGVRGGARGPCGGRGTGQRRLRTPRGRDLSDPQAPVPPADHDAEIADALGDRLREFDGVWDVGPVERTVVTLWWDRRATDRVDKVERSVEPVDRSRSLGPARRRVDDRWSCPRRRPSSPATCRTGRKAPNPPKSRPLWDRWTTAPVAAPCPPGRIRP